MNIPTVDFYCSESARVASDSSLPLADSQNLRIHEATVNVALARLLRDAFGMDAQAEMIVNGRRPDILIQRGSGPVVIESEFAPAHSVDDDALAKLFVKVGGQTVGVTFALVLPSELRDIHEAELPERLLSSCFTWRIWYSTIDSGPDESGSLLEFADSIVASSVRVTDIEEAVTCLEKGAHAAGLTFCDHAGSMFRVAQVFDREESKEVANMAALMCINAMVLHDRLLASNRDIPPPPVFDPDGYMVSGSYVEDLRKSWGRVMEIDYKPIFEKPYEVLSALPIFDAVPFVAECRRAAIRLSRTATAAGHDLSGQVFNRLVADRKFLAAYYTSIPAATLLSGLALIPEQWPDVDWGDIDSIRKFVVLDPACGTGTLLMAAYQRIVRNHLGTERSNGRASEDDLHRALIEDSIHGSDVVDAAIHLTASTLAAMAPLATFDSMNVHVFPLGVDSTEGGQAKIGSLEWLDTQSVWSMFSGAAKQVSSNGSRTRAQVPRPNANLVIANPPFRRHNSATGYGEYNTRVFGQAEEDAPELSARVSEVIKGTPANLIAGLGSVFVLLADRTICASDRIAFVLPASALSGTSWSGIRRLLAEDYHVEWVVALHDPRDQSLSFDTGIGEVLLVARKLGEEEEAPRRARFVNLWRRPEYAGEAEALLRQLRRLPRPQFSLEGPPIGGSELSLGSEKWGEIVDAPIDAGPWMGSRWRSTVVGQYAYSLKSGDLWADDASRLIGQMPIQDLESVASISPYHLQIRGTQGAYDLKDGWDISDRYPGMWHVTSNSQRTMNNSPDARLIPKHTERAIDLWRNAGYLHIASEVRYTSQSILATKTDTRALGVRSWFTLTIRDVDVDRRELVEAAMVVWLNTTPGMLLHANHANRSQLGRGTGNRTMLRTLPVLDVRKLTDDQLEAARETYLEIQEMEFEPFFKCAVDPARIEIDERFVRDVSGLPRGAVDSVSDLRQLLALEPSIHGTKMPELP